MIGRGLFAGLLIFAAASPALAQEKQPPYWASIASGKAMTRNGPARTYPGKWVYQRRDLPVRILQKYENWRLIQDPDGDKGWMLVTLLSDKRTVIVPNGEPRPIYSEANANSRVRYRAEAGVVMTIAPAASAIVVVISPICPSPDFPLPGGEREIQSTSSLESTPQTSLV